MRAWYLQAIGGLLSVCLVVGGVLLPASVSRAAPAGQPAPPPASAATATPAVPVEVEPVEELLARVDPIKRVLARMQRDLDQSPTNIAALAFTLDNDADAALAWVRQEIAFEQYPGSLRGARGTLIGRAGNALDTALLLAAILNDAGYDVRLARGQLAQEDALHLVEQMLLPRPAPATYAEDATLRRLLLELGVALGLTQQEAADALAGAETAVDEVDPQIAQAEADAIFIQATLQSAAIELGDPDALAQLVQEATDYFWVEYRLSAGHRWVAAHPAYKDPARVPRGLRATARWTDKIPSELQHRIRIQVEIEQKLEDQLVTQTVTPAWEWAVADLVGEPLVYRNTLMGMGEVDDPAVLAEMLGEGAIFVPSLNGQLLENGLAFDLNGVTYDPGLVGNDIFRLTQQISSALERALGVLDGGETEEPAPDAVDDDRITLSGQWITYTLIAPGGATRTVRRTILDRVGAELRAEDKAAIAPGQALPDAAAALLTQYTIYVLPTEYSPAYVTTRYVELLKQEVDLFDYLRGQLPFGTEPLSPPLRLLEGRKSFDDVLLNTLMAKVPARSTAQLSYRAAPYLVVLEDGLRLGEELSTGLLRVDVIQNTRRAFTLADGQLQADPAANILAGTWETRVEESPYAAVQGTRFSTMAAFTGAAQMETAAQVLAADDLSQLDALGLSRVSDAAIRQDLAAGYVVILPEPAAAGDVALGWWRVNPRTGETLGLTDDGRGSATVEYSFLAELKANLIIGAPGTFAGYVICMSGASGSAGCCAADAAVAYVGFAALGAGIAKWSAVAAIIIGEGTKIGGITAGATGVGPSFCN